MSLVLAFDCAVSGLGVAVVRDGARLGAAVAKRDADQAARLLPAIADGAAARPASSAARPVADRRHHRTGQLHRRARRPGCGARPRRRRSACRWRASPRHRSCWRRPSRAGGSSSPPSTAVSATGSAPSPRADWRQPFRRRRRGGARAARLGGRACLVIGPGAQALAPQLVAAGIDAVAEQALPDPVALARLAPADAASKCWRARNRREGLPRPLYLRGVNITLPDGARRTVD